MASRVTVQGRQILDGILLAWRAVDGWANAPTKPLSNVSVRRTILRNVISNWAGYAISVAGALILSLFVVRTLGDKLYGLWALIMLLTGYYGPLDLGIRAAVPPFD